MRSYEIDYLHGECMIYAVALANRYGWECVGVYDAIWKDVPRHVGTTHDGLFADVRGKSLSREQFLDGFENYGCEIRPITVEEIKRIWQRRDWTVEPDLEK